MKITLPNSTQIPNIVFDYWMNELSHAEFKVLLCICRKTFGWRKDSDRISRSQIAKMTGVNRDTVRKCIQVLEEKGLILKFESKNELGDNDPNLYEINVFEPDCSEGGGGLNANPLADETPTRWADETPHKINTHTKQIPTKEDPPSPQKGEVPPEVRTLCNHFQEKIKQNNRAFKVKNEKLWLEDLDKLMRIDKKSFEEVRSMIDWVTQDRFWKANILSPAKLREKFDELVLKKNLAGSNERIAKNKKFAMYKKTNFPSEFKGLVITNSAAINSFNSKDVSLDMDEKLFREAFVRIFAGDQYGK